MYILLKHNVVSWKLYLETLNITKAFNLIYKRITIRTFTDPLSVTEEKYAASTNADIASVLLKYFAETSLRIIFLFFLIPAVAIASLTGFYYIRKFTMLKIEKKQFTAILMTTYLSILAKGYSFIHVQLNYVLWYVPYMIFGFLLITYVVKIFLIRKFY